MSILSLLPFFFFNDTATTEIYTLSLHDALPISGSSKHGTEFLCIAWRKDGKSLEEIRGMATNCDLFEALRSEEHTSELQSLTNLVCRLLLEKKKRQQQHETLIHLISKP